MSNGALGMIETKGLLSSLYAMDVIAKSASVTISNMPGVENQKNTIIIRGDIRSVKTALNAATDALQADNDLLASHFIPRPHHDVEKMLAGQLSPDLMFDMKNLALGLIETKGYVAAIEAADVACKTVDIQFIGIEQSRRDIMMITFLGEEDSVEAALDASVRASSDIHEVISSRVILNPSKELFSIFTADKIIQTSPHKAEVQSPKERVNEFLIEEQKIGAEQKITEKKKRPGRPQKITSVIADQSMMFNEHKAEFDSAISVPAEPAAKVEKEAKLPLRIKPAPLKPHRRREEPLINTSAFSIEEKISVIANYSTLPVWKLRRIVRDTTGVRMFGREVSRANKEQLLQELRYAYQLS